MNKFRLSSRFLLQSILPLLRRSWQKVLT